MSASTLALDLQLAPQAGRLAVEMHGADLVRLHVTAESVRENADILLDLLEKDVTARAEQIIADREEQVAQRRDRNLDRL